MSAALADAPAAPDPAESADLPARTGASADPSLFSYLRLVLSAVLLLGVIAAGMILIVLPKATHSYPLTVLTQSMEPGYPPGTLLVVSQVDPWDVRIGDIVTYQIESGRPDVITHRVVGIADDASGHRTFTFQGDNNALPDADPVLPIQIRGRLWYAVPVIGWAAMWLNGDARQVIVPVAAGILFSFAGWMFLSWGVGRVRGARRGALATGELPAARPAPRSTRGAVDDALVWADPDIWIPFERMLAEAAAEAEGVVETEPTPPPVPEAEQAPAPGSAASESALVWADADLWMPEERAPRDPRHPLEALRLLLLRLVEPPVVTGR